MRGGQKLILKSFLGLEKKFLIFNRIFPIVVLVFAYEIYTNMQFLKKSFVILFKRKPKRVDFLEIPY